MSKPIMNAVLLCCTSLSEADYLRSMFHRDIPVNVNPLCTRTQAFFGAANYVGLEEIAGLADRLSARLTQA